MCILNFGNSRGRVIVHVGFRENEFGCIGTNLDKFIDWIGIIVIVYFGLISDMLIDIVFAKH